MANNADKAGDRAGGGRSGGRGGASGSSSGGMRGGMAEKNASRQGRGEHANSAGEGRGGMAEKNAERQGRGEHANSGGLGSTTGGGPSSRPNNGPSPAARDRARQAMSGKSVRGPSTRPNPNVSDLSRIDSKLSRGVGITSEEHDMVSGMQAGAQTQTATGMMAGVVSRGLSAVADLGVPGISNLAAKGVTSLGVNSAMDAAREKQPSTAAKLGFDMGVNRAKPGLAGGLASMATGMVAGPVAGMAVNTGISAARTAEIDAVAKKAGIGTGTQTAGNPSVSGKQASATKAKTALASAPQVTSPAPARMTNEAPTIDTANIGRGLLDAARTGMI